MATQEKKKQALFPDYPRARIVVDELGALYPFWENGLASLFQALQKNWKNEGIMVPPLSDTEITDIENVYSTFVGGSYQDMLKKLPDISGQMAYDKVNYLPKIFIIQVIAGNVSSARWWTFTIT